MAKRSRPPTLLTIAQRAIRDDALMSRGDTVLCACSGGPDSSALLHVLALLRRRIHHTVVAVGIDHGLRSSAGAELELARGQARAHDVRFDAVRIELAAGSNLQARARDARHQALQAAAARLGANVIALGHTADDRAETVMLRLLRGAGPRGLAALPPRAPSLVEGGVPLVRPLLRARRSDVLAHIDRHAVRYAEDPSNRDLRFMRVRVRSQLMPLLEELSPGIVGHLCALADMLFQQRDNGDPLAELGRAQRLMIERAIRLKKGGTTVRVSGGRELKLRFLGGTPVLFEEE